MPTVAALTLPARAKVNLTLSVGRRRADGYHLIESLMQSVSLADTVHLFPSSAGIEIETDHAEIPAGEANPAWRAALALATEAGVRRGVRIVIEKAIPIAAGLGGGSADAAAVLRGLNRLWGLGWPKERLLAIAARIGADVPFCVTGGTAIARGIGERLEPVASVPPMWLVLANPGIPLATREVFAAYDADPAPAAAVVPDARAAVAALQGDRPWLGAGMGNQLEPIARRLCPAIGEVIDALVQAGAGRAFLTGSGPTVVALAPGSREAMEMAAAVRRAGVPWVWAGATVPEPEPLR
ncbi:MAG TPA: 4-(cytidine 5'-diphospho)-2-C-methyl-D-erythritol kinase [Limnochordia bacterium]